MKKNHDKGHGRGVEESAVNTEASKTYDYD